jgi:uncharacterized repeat protein (TIGR03803 family)
MLRQHQVQSLHKSPAVCRHGAREAIVIQRRVLTCLVIVLSSILLPLLAFGQYSVQLSWQPSTSQVAGYNVYRGGASGGPYAQINSTLDTLTSFSDKSVQAGQTYYYVTTAVDSLGRQSSYSNQTEAEIPTGGPRAENTLVNFGSSTNPTQPYAGLILDKSGNLYGTTELGGAYDQGTVFELTRNSSGGWIQTVLYNFTGGGDGGQPAGGLLFDASGNLLGTTMFGGTGSCTNGCGTVFKLAAGNWSESIIYSFSGGSDGAEPYAGLISDSSGNVYGTTLLGGTVNSSCSSGCGTVFKLSLSSSDWSETVLHSFVGGNDGESPYAGLIFDSSGSLYGTTYGGGAYSQGTVFKLTPAAGGSWNERLLHSFRGKSDGGNPYASLIFDQSGNLYGTAFAGAAGYGVVFELTLTSTGSWKEQVLHAFGNAPSANPVAGLTMDTHGSLYGTTMLGGNLSACGGGCGTIFRMVPANGGWTFNPFHVFGRGSDGYHPSGQLVIDSNGTLYGTTQAGGADGGGVVFMVSSQ